VIERATVRLIVLGFSQGGATAARWSLRGKANVDRLILWGSALPPEIDDDEKLLAKTRQTPLTIVNGTRDRFVTEQVRERERERLARLEIPYRELRFEGGHRLDDDTLSAIAEELS
jgi:predicted esterase